MAKQSRQALEAADNKDEGWGSISAKSLAEFFDWLEEEDDDKPLLS